MLACLYQFVSLLTYEWQRRQTLRKLALVIALIGRVSLRQQQVSHSIPVACWFCTQTREGFNRTA
jgi:hypothetical protein